MGRLYFVLSLFLVYVAGQEEGSGGTSTCLHLDAAFAYNGDTYLFSNDLTIQLDENLTEVNTFKTEGFWGELEDMDAALHFDHKTFFFRYTENFLYSSSYGLIGPVDNEDNWGEKLNGGVTAAASFDNTRAIFLYHCRYYKYTKGHHMTGPHSLYKIGLPCEIDAAFRLFEDNGDDDDDGRIALVKFNQMWYMSANGSVEGPVDANSKITLKKYTLCSPDGHDGGSGVRITKRHAQKMKSFEKLFNKLDWKDFDDDDDSEDWSEEWSEEFEESHERALVKLLHYLLNERFGHGDENETKHERFERELILARLKAWVAHEIRDEESEESYDGDSTDVDSEELFRVLGHKRFKRHVPFLHGFHSSDESETESEEQKREQAKEMYEQNLEYLKEHGGHKHHKHGKWD